MVIAAFALGLAASERLSAVRAAPAAMAISLGRSAAEVMSAEGAPTKIDWDPQGTQTWYYGNEDQAIMPRYILSHGLVVRVFPRKH
jgi:hypothetical protein